MIHSISTLYSFCLTYYLYDFCYRSIFIQDNLSYQKSELTTAMIVLLLLLLLMCYHIK